MEFPVRLITASLLVLSLSGCSFVEEVFLSASEKLNRAFPPSAEVRATEESLGILLAEDAPAKKAFVAQYESLREIRGLTCGKNLAISKFDSLADIRKLPVSHDCLNQQDQILLRFLQAKQVERRLSQDALRPFAPLAAPNFVAPGVPISTGVAASAANVAVLSGTRGELLSVEIPSGKPIVKLPTLNGAQFHNALLSPNGRILALAPGYGKGLKLFDTETGTTLWENSEINQLLVWLPELSAALASDSEGRLTVLDFRSGEPASEVPALKRQSWAVSLPGHRVAIGNGQVISIMTFERGANGIEGTILKSLTISSGAGVTSLRPTSMLDGHALFCVTMRDLMKLDLDTGEETVWKTGEFIGNRYAKLSESTVLVDAYESAVKTRPWALNIEDATISPVQSKNGKGGIISELDGRAGFMRREMDGIWFGLQLPLGDPVALDEFLSSRNLERQMAKLDAMTRQNLVVSPLQAGAAILPMTGYAIGQAQRQPAGPAPFAELARKAQIEGVGVYESSNPLPSGPGNRPGSISLAVRPTAKPLILVLSSYESVTWRIMQGKDNIKLILLSSYYPSRVEGAGNVRTVVINGGAAYSRTSEGYLQLQRAVAEQTGQTVQIFQSSYQGAHFAVGGQ